MPTEVLHVVQRGVRIEHSQWELLDPKAQIAAKTALAELVREIRALPQTQLLLFSMVTPKADIGFMLLTPDLQVADATAKRLALALGFALYTVFGVRSRGFRGDRRWSGWCLRGLCSRGWFLAFGWLNRLH